jgi:hypothetical protein
VKQDASAEQREQVEEEKRVVLTAREPHLSPHGLSLHAEPRGSVRFTSPDLSYLLLGVQPFPHSGATSQSFNFSLLIFRKSVLTSMPSSCAAAARLPLLRRNASRISSFSIADSDSPEGRPELAPSSLPRRCDGK